MTMAKLESEIMIIKSSNRGRFFILDSPTQ
jgi:hypothetical protein